MLLLVSSACSTERGVEQQIVKDAPLIELRLVRDEAAPGLHPVEHAGETLYLEPEPVLSDRDLERVEPSVRTDALLLDLYLTSDAAERVSSVTGAEIGTRVATVVDSEVRSVPVIRAGVGGPLINMSIRVSEEEATRLASMVYARWP